MQALTFSDLAAPYLALIFGSLMVARLVPVMVNLVPPLKKKKKEKKDEHKVNQDKRRKQTTNKNIIHSLWEQRVPSSW